MRYRAIPAVTIIILFEIVNNFYMESITIFKHCYFHWGQIEVDLLFVL